jgi:prepilin-type N-terminal cleavage/methylation domain-containing protein
MKTIFLNKGYTLVELIVSLSLLCLIVLGIFSINTVLNTNHQDYGQKYSVKSATQATLNHILTDASLAVGSASNVGAGTAASPYELDQGILIGAQMGAGSNNSFCIHQSPGGVDTWMCYTLAANQISYCNKTYTLNDAAGYRGASGACATAAQFLGSAFSITNLPVGSTLPQSPYFSPSSGIMTFSIVIENCLDDSAATCNSGGNGVSGDPANNPEVQLSGSVTPSQEGM